MKLCIYGASSDEIARSYIEDGEELGRHIAKRGHSVIYGGGGAGMMGAVARGAHEQNGEIIGVAPAFFKVDGTLYEHCTDFIYPDTMRERKKMLEEMSDAFIVTPGGIGTFDEFFEIFTLRQLCRHEKAIAIFNINRYFDPMFAMLKNAADQHFMTDKNEELYFVSDDPDAILDYVENYTPTQSKISDYKKIKE